MSDWFEIWKSYSYSISYAYPDLKVPIIIISLLFYRFIEILK